MGSSAANPGGAAPQASGFVATGRPEQIADISLSSTNTQFQLPTNGGLIPNDRYLHSLLMEFQGRMTNPSSGQPTGQQADAPYSLIDTVLVTGYHRVRGANEPFINVRGTDLLNLERMYGGRIPYVVPNTTGAPVFSLNLSNSANATNDIRFVLELPFTPKRIGVGAQMAWILDAPNYDQLKLTVQFADDKSVFTGQTTAPTFSAFGSTTGNPILRVMGRFILGGNSVYGFVPGRVWRYFQENTSGDITSSSVSASRQYNIPRGNRIRGIMIKTGVKSTAISSGNNVYNTVSDTVFANIKVMRGLYKSIRYVADYIGLKFETESMYGIFPATGYALIDWAERGTLREVLNTIGLVAGPSGDTDLYVQADVTGGSNFGALFQVEELRNLPVKLA